ncbi:alpha/beta hydrolase [Frondihabitans australicus]|uniref:Phospholipase/carboxylesterase n=1 Tax=Frondihabitans australicus TaxID=386892 RepID=A0A495IM34_9MICO|nr:alpha/beta hydrolase-fold protein [Frondihabitans australicus]RKR76321.1 phospholipase/carboxylesterase [Frondihabitans australicus]
MTAANSMATSAGQPQWVHAYVTGTGPVVVALHGLGGAETDMVSLAQQLAADALVIAPRAGVLERGIHRWVPRSKPRTKKQSGLIETTGKLAAFISETILEQRLESRPVIVTGFSSGADIALALGILHPGLVDAVVSFSGTYPLGDLDVPDGLEGERFLLVGSDGDTGTDGMTLPRLAAELEARHALAAVRVRPGGRQITATDVATARTWLGEQFPEADGL